MAEVDSVLVVGGGGREAELIAAALDEGVPKVYSTRGEDAVNIGIEGVINTGLGENDHNAIASFASQDKIGLVIIGPEAPIIAGLGNNLRARGVNTYAPNADGGVFEDDKTKTHKFVIKHGLPNPDNSETFTPEQREAAKNHIREHGVENIVTKRVGQEGGKGAKRWGEDQLEEALAEVDAVADKGEDLLLQGTLRGPEYSATFMLDGRGNAVATALSRDHKSLYNYGEGPMTGGMGAFAPLSKEQASWNRRREIALIGQMIAAGLVEENIDFRGTMYAALMAETEEADSDLKVIEFNVRFGDPEAQVIIPKLGRNAIGYMNAAAHGSGENDMSRLFMDDDDDEVLMTVCLASPGYSQAGEELKVNLPIHVPDNLPDDIKLRFAGAKMVGGVPTSSGGRVVYVSSTGRDVYHARENVYGYIGREDEGIFLGDDEQVIRTDIGLV